MRPAFWALAIALALIVAGPAAPAEEPAIFPLKDVKPGMKGVGKTVLSGTGISEFPFEVLDVLRNWLPGQDVILVRCGGDTIQRTGIASGMSGSPCYLDGKIMGALAYAWPWSKEPLAGITPIESMLEVADRKPEKRVESPVSTVTGPLVPIQAPLYVSARSQRCLREFEREFGKFNLRPLGAGNSGGAFRDLNVSFEPGSAIAVVLMDGDMEVYASGTVTCVIGDKVLAFGHPFMGQGEYSLPVANVWTYGVVPSAQMAFKLSAVGKIMGTLAQDRQACILARTGDAPAMMPMKIRISNPRAGSSREYNVRIARHRTYTAAIANFALSDALDVAEPGPGPVSQDVTLKFKPEGMREISVRMYFSKQGGWWGANFMAPLAAFLTNRFEEKRVESVSVEAEIVNEGRTGALTAISVPRLEYHPGETVDLSVEVTPFRSRLFRINVPFRIPDDMPPGNYTLTVAPMDEAPMPEEAPLIENLDTLVKAIESSNHARADRLIAFVRKPGLILQHAGERYPDLPLSVLFGLLPRNETGGLKAAPRFWKSDAVEAGYFLAGDKSVKITVTGASNAK